MNLRKYRLISNLTQQELADKVGVTKSHICEIENGIRQPSLPLFKHLVIILKICPCDALEIRYCIYRDKDELEFNMEE